MSAVPVLLVSARDDVEALLAADPGAISTLVTRVPRLEDLAGAAQRWRVVILDAVSVRDAVDLGARLREASDKLEFIVVTSDPRELVEAIRAGAYQAVSWPCDPAELWDPVAACVKKLAPPAAPDGVGDLRFKEKLASGGMGDVYLADSPRFESSVVVKLMQAAYASVPEFASMFRSEARLSSQLVHPNIVRVLEHGEIDGRLFLAMEHIHGWDLLDVGRALGWRFPPGIAIHIVAEIATALDYAHSRVDESGQPLRIVHRDVNPPNILLSRDGRVLLSDFGIAKSAQATTQTQAGVIKGKVEYFSPEQIVGEPLDGRSDLFPLGAVLYLLLTGAHPFRGTTRNETMKRVRWATFTPPSELVPGLPDGTDAVVARTLTRDRNGRYATAGEMEADLRTLAAPVSADDMAEFLSRSMDERTRVAGARALRSSSTGAVPTGEPTVLRDGAAPGEATVVRTTGAEPTVMRSSPGTSPGTATAERSLFPAVKARPISPARWLGLAVAAAAIVSLAFVLGGGGAGTENGTARATGTPVPRLSPAPSRTALAVATTAREDFPTPAPPASETPSAIATRAVTATPVATALIATTRRPAPSPAATPAGMGTLTIWMPSGWAAISVDGKPLGMNAPRVGIELPAGPHMVTLENPPARYRQDFDVVITANREARLEATLP